MASGECVQLNERLLGSFSDTSQRVKLALKQGGDRSGESQCYPDALNLLEETRRRKKPGPKSQSSCIHEPQNSSRFGNAPATSFKTTFPKLDLRWRGVCT